MTWSLSDTWIVTIGVLCAGSCALLGNFLVLRRMSMMGDAISHAVLPGLAAAFWITGSRSSVAMFAGAAVVGVLTAVFTQWVHSLGKVDRGASMGVVFTTLFAVGLIMIDRIAKHVDLDAGCVLYGAIDLAPLDTVAFLGATVPRAAVVLGGVMILNALTVALFYKEFKITSFDPALATTLGINATFMHYLLMVLVAITTVASFEAIGSILVIAMLIVPAATAFIMTQRLNTMIAASLVVGALSAALGHVAAIVVPPVFGFEDTTTAGMMATVAGLIFTAVMLVAPKQGLITRLLERRRLSNRIVREDILGLLYRVEEQAAAGGIGGMTLVQFDEALQSGPRPIGRAVAQLVGQGKIDRTGQSYALAAQGRSEAQDMIRAHRLWESYLEQNLPLPMDHLHAPAEKLEHITDEAMRRKLAEATSDPEKDPQGKSVPR
jgi:manganese/zinc/iron transport system permease protein